MRRQVLVVAVAAALVAVATADRTACGAGDTLAAAAEKVRAAKVREAAVRSIDASIGLLEERLGTPEAYTVEMLADAGRHRLRSESEGRLRQRERERLTAAVREQLVAFADERAGDLPEGWVDDVMTREQSRIDATVQRLLDAQFDVRYDRARRRAVRVQRGQLDEVLYPGSADIEALAGPPAEFAALGSQAIAGRVATPDAQALIAEYVAAIGAEGPLFEENEATLERRLRQALHEALVLLWRQLRLVARADAEGARERSAIAARILEDLERLAAEAEQLTGTDYGVFPSAQTLALERAGRLEIEGFATFVRGELDLSARCPALPEERVLRDVPRSFDRVPPDLGTHAQELERSLRGPTAERIVGAYAALVDDAALRVPLRQRLESALGEETDVQRLLAEGLGACIRAPLGSRREELAAAELAARLPAVADLSFELADSALRAVASHPAGAPDVSQFPGPGELHMEESRAAYDRQRQQLLAEARDVLWRQTAMAREPERKASFVEQIESDADRSDARKEYWHQAYETSVLDAWRHGRTEVLLKDAAGAPRHPDKYDRVFGPVSEIIDEIITLEFARTEPATEAPTAGSAEAMGAGDATTVAAATQAQAGPPAGEQNAAADTAEEAPAPQSGARQPGDGQVASTPGVPQPEPTEPQRGPPSGGVPCDELLERCSLANTVCYQALVSCRSKPETCDVGISRCRTAADRCEQARQPESPFDGRALRPLGTDRAAVDSAGDVASLP